MSGNSRFMKSSTPSASDGLRSLTTGQGEGIGCPNLPGNDASQDDFRANRATSHAATKLHTAEPSSGTPGTLSLRRPRKEGGRPAPISPRQESGAPHPETTPA